MDNSEKPALRIHMHGDSDLDADLICRARQQAETNRALCSRDLRALACRFVMAQEGERRDIARELHDEIGQALVVMQINLQWMIKMPEAGALTPLLTENLNAVEKMIDQVRDISHNLRPPVLDDLGLEPAVHWCTERQATLGGLSVEFHTDSLEARLETVIETACFRVAQEALSNVVRHAQAKSLVVELCQEEGLLHLRVRDDGGGFDAATARENAVGGASLGLLSMEEWSKLAGGGLEFLSSPGMGAEVHAWFPLTWQVPPTGS